MKGQKGSTRSIEPYPCVPSFFYSSSPFSPYLMNNSIVFDVHIELQLNLRLKIETRWKIKESQKKSKEVKRSQQKSTEVNRSQQKSTEVNRSHRVRESESQESEN